MPKYIYTTPSGKKIDIDTDEDLEQLKLNPKYDASRLSEVYELSQRLINDFDKPNTIVEDDTIEELPQYKRQEEISSKLFPRYSQLPEDAGFIQSSLATAGDILSLPGRGLAALAGGGSIGDIHPSLDERDIGFREEYPYIATISDISEGVLRDPLTPLTMGAGALLGGAAKTVPVISKLVSPSKTAMGAIGQGAAAATGLAGADIGLQYGDPTREYDPLQTAITAGSGFISPALKYRGGVSRRTNRARLGLTEDQYKHVEPGVIFDRDAPALHAKLQDKISKEVDKVKGLNVTKDQYEGSFANAQSMTKYKLKKLVQDGTISDIQYANALDELNKLDLKIYLDDTVDGLPKKDIGRRSAEFIDEIPLKKAAGHADEIKKGAKPIMDLHTEIYDHLSGSGKDIARNILSDEFNTALHVNATTAADAYIDIKQLEYLLNYVYSDLDRAVSRVVPTDLKDAAMLLGRENRMIIPKVHAKDVLMEKIGRQLEVPFAPYLPLVRHTPGAILSGNNSN